MNHAGGGTAGILAYPLCRAAAFPTLLQAVGTLCGPPPSSGSVAGSMCSATRPFSGLQQRDCSGFAPDSLLIRLALLVWFRLRFLLNRNQFRVQSYSNSLELENICRVFCPTDSILKYIWANDSVFDILKGIVFISLVSFLLFFLFNLKPAVPPWPVWVGWPCRPPGGMQSERKSLCRQNRFRAVKGFVLVSWFLFPETGFSPARRSGR